ncbi:MAG: MFS transporter [Hyphomicrobium sp.]
MMLHMFQQPGLAVVIAEGFLARLAFGVISFSLPFYALALGMSYAEVGVLAALRVAVALAMKPVMGHAADRFGVKTIYLASIAGRVLIAVLFIFATTPLALFLVRGLHGVTTAARDPTSALLLMEHADDKRIASAFSWYATAKVAGAALGFPLAGLLLAATGDDYPLVFLLAAAVSAVALVLVWRFAAEERAETPSEGPTDALASDEAPPQGLNASDWSRYALLALAVALPASMVSGLLPLIVAEQTGLGKAEIGFMYAISTGVVILLGPLLGWFADHVSRAAVLALRSLANILSSILYLVLPGFWGMTAARVVDDAGKAAFQPAWGSVMSEIARADDRRTRGRRLAYMDTAESIGEALGPALAGALWQFGGLHWLFLARIAIAIGAELYAVRVLRALPAAVKAP